MKLLAILISLVPARSWGKRIPAEKAETAAWDASLVMPSWEEHPKAREFRRNNEPSFLRDYYHFR